MNYLQEHYNEIFKKYSNEEIIKDIEKYKYEDGSLQKTLNQFFEETIFKCCGKKSDLSPWDALQNEEITNKILSYIESKPKFFTGTEIQNSHQKKQEIYTSDIMILMAKKLIVLILLWDLEVECLLLY